VVRGPYQICFIPIDVNMRSGIFGYISYLVEKDRRHIIDILLNGEMSMRARLLSSPCLLTVAQGLRDWSIGATTQLGLPSMGISEAKSLPLRRWERLPS
jgi:hypothetical protein